MKVEMYSPEPKKKEEIFRLRLIETENNGINLYLVDEKGRQLSGGRILTITQDMEIERANCMKVIPGLPLDSVGRLKIGRE